MALKNYALASLGVDVFVSSTLAGYSASAVINGLRHTNGNNTNMAWASSGDVPQWVTVDLGEVKSVHQIEVIGMTQNLFNYAEPSLAETFQTQGLVEYKVQYWSGGAWVDLANVKNNNRVRRRFEFEPVDAQEFRVLISKTPPLPSGTNYARIVAIEIWGEELNADFEAPSVVGVGENFTINNKSKGQEGLTYVIDLGNGEATTTDPDAVFSYATEGNYRFSLTVSNGTTTSTASKVIRVIYDSKLFPLEFAELNCGSQFFTTVTTGGISAMEQRIRHRSRARDYFNAAFALQTPEDVEVLHNFFLNCGGKFSTFLLHDPSDWKCERTLIVPRGDGAKENFQMQKRYEDVYGNVYYKNIMRPKRGTVQVWIDDIPQTEDDFAVDYEGGLISFDSAPAANAVIEFECNFFKNVRFEDDELDIEVLQFWVENQKNYGLVQPPSIQIVEVFT